MIAKLQFFVFFLTKGPISFLISISILYLFSLVCLKYVKTRSVKLGINLMLKYLTTWKASKIKTN